MHNFRRLHLHNFMSHTNTVLELPERGLVVVTGDNGAGKSSFVEAASWVGWGKTLRSTAPWRADTAAQPCRVQAELDGFDVERQRVNNKNKTTWSDSEQYENNTKALEALEHVMGGWELWRRTHVFSSADALLFSLATDGDRKRLIEGFLGVEKFDPALKACRADLVKAEAKEARCRQATTEFELKLEAERRRLKETKQELSSLVEPPTPPVPTDEKDYARMISTTRHELNEARASLRRIDAAGGEQEAQAKELRRLLERLHANTCPTCSQDIPHALRVGLQEKIKAAQAAGQAAKADAAELRAEAEAAIEELEEELEGLRRKRDAVEAARAAVKAQAAALKAYKEQHARLEGRLRSCEAAIDELVQAAEENAAALASAETELGELRAAEVALGLKGVRAHILGGALAGIESVTNGWLARLGKGLTVELSPYSENADGGVKDSISLKINGAGGSGYREKSNGERRRVDLALLLALGEVAWASAGKPAGTLWFDEAFDGLDEEGVQCASEVLRELAATRAVVVITHYPPLIRRLADCRRVHVAHGALGELG